jgi:hypothetical protein
LKHIVQVAIVMLVYILFSALLIGKLAFPHSSTASSLDPFRSSHFNLHCCGLIVDHNRYCLITAHIQWPVLPYIVIYISYVWFMCGPVCHDFATRRPSVGRAPIDYIYEMPSRFIWRQKQETRGPWVALWLMGMTRGATREFTTKTVNVTSHACVYNYFWRKILYYTFSIVTYKSEPFYKRGNSWHAETDTLWLIYEFL